MTIPLFVTLAKMTRHRGFHRWATTLALFAGILAQYALVLIPTASCGGSEALSPVPRSRSSSSSSWVSAKYSTRAPSRTTSRSARWWPSSRRRTPELAKLRWRRCGAAIVEGPMGEGVAPPDVLADNSSDASVFTLREPQMSNFRFDLMGESHSTLPLPVLEEYACKAGKLEQGTFCADPRGGRRLDRPRIPCRCGTCARTTGGIS